MDNRTYLSIKNWAEEDRPREKLIQKGRSALSDAELLAILLGSGTKSLSALDIARGILKEVDNDISELSRLNIGELTKFKGVGQARAVAIVSALELGRRRKPTNDSQDQIIKSSQDVYQAVKSDLIDIPHEEFWVLLLNRKNKVIKKIKISSGGISATVVDPRLIFKPALDIYASAIICIHNHPSGNLSPSKEDISLTQKLKKSGELLEIHILDHIIFSNNGYFSFLDEGII